MMQAFFFVYPRGHANYGGYVKVIAPDWKSAKEMYDSEFDIDDNSRDKKRRRDYSNFYSREYFKFDKCPRGELKLIM